MHNFKEISSIESKQINGGGFSVALVIGGVALLIFGLGALSGYVNPTGCN